MTVIFALSDNEFSRDLSQCSRCRAVLSRWDYGTDAIGRTVERCPACGPRLLVIRSAPPLVRKVAIAFKKGPWASNPTLAPCACGAPVEWKGGSGRKPVFCEACRDANRATRQRTYDRLYHAQSRARTRAKRDACKLSRGALTNDGKGVA